MVRFYVCFEARSKTLLLDGLDVGCKIKRGIKDDSKVFGLSSWKNVVVINSSGKAGFGRRRSGVWFYILQSLRSLSDT